MDVQIKDGQLTELKDKVALITGGSSGIGLATAKLFASKGARVVIGDINPPKEEVPGVVFVQTDVREWNDLVNLFNAAEEKYGRIDVVFANAGVGPAAEYVDLELDGTGKPLEPAQKCLDINLRGCINTASLGIFYMTKQPSGGSVILTASASSYMQFGATDYTTAKHGVVGFMRGILPVLKLRDRSNIRVNCLAPSWTDTNIVSAELLRDTLHVEAQSPTVVAYSAGLLAVDGSRNGQTIYSIGGKYREIDQGCLEANRKLMTIEEPDGTKKDGEEAHWEKLYEHLNTRRKEV